ncbi:MBG domain-containing protein [Parachryseolinea silvisoli]|uniref:MBG domain-containing protein n=1 Tax=Parachryseolinea silvisoli TaxID=2873601 RepID=UPI002265B9C9|nr:MBG domain-containing protein [Parachryseolinea silvisoli]MCD9017932.1 MBG domain-containing protein [Parachryseolinea silvisoli]
MKRNLPLKSFLTAVLLTVLCLGAGAQSFWTQSDGPYGISLWNFFITEDGTYYGGASDGKLYRKLPHSTRWEIVWSEYGTILSIYEKDDVMFVGNADGILVSSTDNGDTWEVMNNGLEEAPQVRDFAENSKGELFAATSSGIYKMIPGAKPGVFSWQKKPYSSQYGSFIFTLCTDKLGTMYAGTGRGIYRSDDGGETWQVSALAEEANSIFSIATSANGDVYAGTSDDGLYINYADDGQPDTWKPLAEEIMGGTQARKVSILNSNQVFVSISGDGVYYSENNTDWEKLVSGSSHGGTQYDPIEHEYVVSSFNGLWTSSDTKPYSFTQTGIPQSIGFITARHSTVSVIAETNTVFTSPDQGTSWTPVIGNSEGIITSYETKDNGDRLVGMFGGVTGSPWVQAYRYIDFTNGWGWWSIGFDESVKRISDILVTANDSIFVATDQGLYRIDSKTYESSRWLKIGPSFALRVLAEDGKGNLYMGSDDGLYISQDGGKTAGIHLLNNVVINSVTTTVEGTAYLATEEGIYYLAGPESEPLLVDVPHGKVTSFNDVAIDAQGHLYAATRGAVFYAENKDAVWEEQLSGIEGYEYYGLQVADNVVYVATNVGLYKHVYAQQAVITLSGTGSFEYSGQARKATAQTTPAGLDVEILYNGVADVPVAGGTYLVTARVNDGVFAGTATGRIKIGKAPATITLNGLGTHSYTGEQQPVTATTEPAGLPVVFTYNNTSDVPVEIGEYYVIATIEHPSYHGQAAGDMIIRDAVLGVEDPHNKLVSVHPVPARNTLTVESMQGRMRTIVLLDAMGRVVDRREFTKPVEKHSFDATRYAPGMVLIQITTDTAKRIVKRAQVIR